jgi:hypothetical protein
VRLTILVRWNEGIDGSQCRDAVAIGFLQQFVTCAIDHDRPAGAKAVAKVFYGLRCDDAVIAGTDQQGRHLDPVKMLEPSDTISSR